MLDTAFVFTCSVDNFYRINIEDVEIATDAAFSTHGRILQSVSILCQLFTQS